MSAFASPHHNSLAWKQTQRHCSQVLSDPRCALLAALHQHAEPARQSTASPLETKARVLKLCAGLLAGCGASRCRRTDRQLVRRAACAVRLEDATVRTGPNIVLQEADLDINQGARAAILGPNGCGKSTLLRTLAGRIPVESGALILEAKKLAWLKQEATAGSTKTVMEEAVSEMAAEGAVAEELAEATKLLETASTQEEIDRAMEAFEKANEKFEAAGGYDKEDKAEQVLFGLGFSRADFDRPCSELSGGWQMKVALARALLVDGDMLLLDEPTNHMDASAKDWLGKYLADDLRQSTTLLVVTHDRSLLERIRLNTVVEISDKNILKFDAKSIKDWSKQRRKLGQVLGNEIKKLSKQITVDTAWCQKWGAKASFASKVQGRLKTVERMKKRVRKLEEMTRGLPEDEFLEDDEVDEGDGMLPLADKGNVFLKLPEAPLFRGGPLDGILLGFSNGQVGYTAEKPIVKGIDLKLMPGMRVALLGPNGAGKTTILRHLYGSMPLQAGERKLGVSTTKGEAGIELFTQDLAQDLPPDASPVDYVIEASGSVELARATLGALGLKSDVHNSRIRDLSGGEKGRVALAVFALTPADVLLMDEPTNHLDRVAVTALARGLRERNGGALLVSSHDEAFVEALEVTHHAVVTKGQDGMPGSLKLVKVERKELVAA